MTTIDDGGSTVLVLSGGGGPMMGTIGRGCGNGGSGVGGKAVVVGDVVVIRVLQYVDTDK